MMERAGTAAAAVAAVAAAATTTTAAAATATATALKPFPQRYTIVARGHDVTMGL